MRGRTPATCRSGTSAAKWAQRCELLWGEHHYAQGVAGVNASYKHTGKKQKRHEHATRNQSDVHAPSAQASLSVMQLLCQPIPSPAAAASLRRLAFLRRRRDLPGSVPTAATAAAATATSSPCRQPPHKAPEVGILGQHARKLCSLLGVPFSKMRHADLVPQ